MVGVPQVLYGTDFPYRDGAEVNDGIAAWNFSAADLRSIESETARKLLPKLKLGVAVAPFGRSLRHSDGCHAGTEQRTRCCKKAREATMTSGRGVNTPCAGAGRAIAAITVMADCAFSARRRQRRPTALRQQPGTLAHTTGTAIAKVLKEKGGLNTLVQTTAGEPS